MKYEIWCLEVICDADSDYATESPTDKINGI